MPLVGIKYSSTVVLPGDILDTVQVACDDNVGTAHEGIVIIHISYLAIVQIRAQHSHQWLLLMAL